MVVSGVEIPNDSWYKIYNALRKMRNQVQICHYPQSMAYKFSVNTDKGCIEVAYVFTSEFPKGAYQITFLNSNTYYKCVDIEIMARYIFFRLNPNIETLREVQHETESKK